MLIATLAWNLKSWFAMMMHRKTDRRDYIRDGVPPLPARHHPDPGHGQPPGPHHHRPADRLPAPASTGSSAPGPSSNAPVSADTTARPATRRPTATAAITRGGDASCPEAEIGCPERENRPSTTTDTRVTRSSVPPTHPELGPSSPDA